MHRPGTIHMGCWETIPQPSDCPQGALGELQQGRFTMQIRGVHSQAVPGVSMLPQAEYTAAPSRMC